jgi:hypothetical protein
LISRRFAGGESGTTPPALHVIQSGVIMIKNAVYRACACLVLLLAMLSAAHILQAEEAAAPAVEAEDEHREDTGKKGDRSVNLDMKMVYGQYNTMLSTVNLSQDAEDFVYLINSNFKRSNDFGYRDTTYQNSSYYENNIGFTGNLNATEKWRSTLEMELTNDSRGMFDNPVYNREEKEKAKLSLKNVVKLSRSFEMYLTLGGAQYVHRLRTAATEVPENSRVNQGNVKLGGEYIWSTTNGIRFKTQYFYYDYLEETVEDDQFFSGELVDDFHITRNIGISLGANLCLNRDDDPLVAPILSLSMKDFRYASVVLTYRADLAPFRPEIFYLQQKYIMPTYDLPPGKVHHGDMRCEFRLSEAFSLIAQFIVERNDNYYNYYPVTGNVLSAQTLEVMVYRSRFDLNVALFGRMLEYSLGYEFNRYEADFNITYSPAHSFTSALKYNGRRWTFEWNNRYLGQVYTDPDADTQLGNVIIGDFGIQRKMLESFFAYIKIENLYDYRYNLRDGYPEQGITVLGGIRVLI